MTIYSEIVTDTRDSSLSELLGVICWSDQIGQQAKRTRTHTQTRVSFI